MFEIVVKKFRYLCRNQELNVLFYNSAKNFNVVTVKSPKKQAKWPTFFQIFDCFFQFLTFTLIALSPTPSLNNNKTKQTNKQINKQTNK